MLSNILNHYRYEERALKCQDGFGSCKLTLGRLIADGSNGQE
jgi:hypothetical protein